MLAFPLLVYAPYPLQRRLAEGFWVALIVLLFLYIENTKGGLSRGFKLILLLVLPSTFILFAGSFLAAGNLEKPLFRPADEVDAFQYLQAHTDGEAVVLSTYETGNPMPAWAPVFVVIGHGPESVFLSELEPRVGAFYQAETPSTQRIQFLDEFDVDFVFWGPAERELGTWQPATESFLTLVFNNREVEIYQVTLP